MRPPTQHPITEEERETVVRGDDYESLKVHPGWRRMREELSRLEERAQNDVMAEVSPDPLVTALVVAEWRVTRRLVGFVDIQIESAIADRDRLREDLKEYGITD